MIGKDDDAKYRKIFVMYVGSFGECYVTSGEQKCLIGKNV